MRITIYEWKCLMPLITLRSAYNGVNTTWGSSLFGHVTSMALGPRGPDGIEVQFLSRPARDSWRGERLRRCFMAKTLFHFCNGGASDPVCLRGRSSELLSGRRRAEVRRCPSPVWAGSLRSDTYADVRSICWTSGRSRSQDSARRRNGVPKWPSWKEDRNYLLWGKDRSSVLWAQDSNLLWDTDNVRLLYAALEEKPLTHGSPRRAAAIHALLP